jgi:hypothetical protein
MSPTNWVEGMVPSWRDFIHPRHINTQPAVTSTIQFATVIRASPAHGDRFLVFRHCGLFHERYWRFVREHRIGELPGQCVG